MAAPRLLLGQTLSHYRIAEKIGGGGMGVVFKAEDTRLHRFVALKFLPPELSTDSHALARFRREAQAASALNHPHICTIHDIGEESGHAFIAMELLEGETLKEKIQQGSLAVREVLEIARQIAEGLAAAHEKGIVHRDLKPANVFVSRTGQSKILDFGLAKVLPKRVVEDPAITEPTADPEDALTSPGMAIGTVAYMSPEQVRGEKLDARSDLFSFGVVLYEMATGRMAFPGNTCGVIFEAILNRAPVPPMQLRPELPVRLTEIIAKALEKNASVRYQQAAEICADLRRLQRDWEPGRDESAAAGRKEGRERVAGGTGRWVLARWAYLAVLLGCALALAGATTLVFPDASRATWQRLFGPALPPQKNLVVLPFRSVDQQASEEAYCNGFTETVTAKLAQIDALQVPSALDVRTRGVATTEDARKNFGANLVLVPTWQHFQDQARINLSLVDPKTGRQLRTETITESTSDLLHLQDQVVSKASRMLQLQLSGSAASYLTAHGTTVPAAYDFYVQGVGYLQRYERAENVENAIGRLRQAVQEDSKYAQAHAALALAYWYKYSSTRESEWLEESKAEVKAAVDVDSQLPEVQLAIGNVNLRTGALAEALTAFQHVLELDARNPDGYLGMARTYSAQGRFGDAERAYRDAIAASPARWDCYNSLGQFLNAHARYTEAIQNWQKVTELAPDNVWGYMNIGVAYFNLGEFARANEYFGRGMQIDPNNSDLYSDAGTMSFYLGRFEESAGYFRKAIALKPRKYDYWGNLADAYRWIPAEASKALETYRKAISLAEEQLRMNPSDTDVPASLALYYARVNDRKRSLTFLEKALKANPDDMDTLTNAALIHLQFGEKDEAMRWLKRAVARGYTREQLLANADLNGLHSDAEFSLLIRQPKSNR